MVDSGRKAFDGFVGSGSGDICRISGTGGGRGTSDGFVGALPLYMQKILGANRARKILLMVLSVRYRRICRNFPTHTHTALRVNCKIDYSLYSRRIVYGGSVGALNFPGIRSPLTDKTIKSPPLPPLPGSRNFQEYPRREPTKPAKVPCQSPAMAENPIAPYHQKQQKPQKDRGA
jgi:hypothetical protein